MGHTIDTIKPEQGPQQKQSRSHLAPVFVLLFLAPAVAELLLGNISPNGSLPIVFLLDVTYYGTGAILIREIVRRRGLHWWWIPMLAFAYGLLEEGLALHSLFNPNFPGVGSLGFALQLFGVDWLWASYVLGLHTVWSISTPTLVTELLFPAARHQRWLGNIGFSINTLVFILGMAAIAFAYDTSVTQDFKPDPITQICTALLILVILLLALFWRVGPASAQKVAKPVPHPWSVGVILFLLGVCYLFIHEIPTSAYPATLGFVLHLALGAVAVVLLARWSNSACWSEMHWVAVASAALLADCVIGFKVSDPTFPAQILHSILSVLTLVLLILLARRVQVRMQR
jgi:hypothetical protein